MIALLLLGCQQDPISITQVADTITQVSKDPTLAQTLCPTITLPSSQDECWLIALDQLKNATVEVLETYCHPVQEHAGECWFRVAEKSGEAEHCSQATPFEQDCRYHLLSRWLFRTKPTDWNVMQTYAESVGLDPASEQSLTILYRHLLSQTPAINPTICEASPDANYCLRAAEGMYRDRLRFAESQGTFPCLMDASHPLYHQTHPHLMTQYQEFHDANCPH